MTAPDQATLRRFLLGELSADQSAIVEEYIETHPESAAALTALEAEDSFTIALRRHAELSQGSPEAEELARHFAELASIPLDKLPTRSVGDPSVDSAQIPDSNKSAEDVRSMLAPAQQPDELGRLGDYRVLRVLGEGGMGVVFEAEDVRLGRHVAVKAMRPSVAQSPTAKARFRREAKAAAALHHDHVIPIHLIAEERGVPFLVMPFLAGESLDSRLKREGTLPVAEILRIGRETAEGLAAAHERGLIHRDIKPANLWLEAPSGRVKILDFGLARGLNTGDGPGSDITQTGAVVGTPAYMSPEQGRGQAVDARSDLFSLGAVLYRMATGQLPFNGTDSMSMLMSLAADTPADPCQLNPRIPPALAAVIMRLLEKDAMKRPQSAREVVSLLAPSPFVEALPNPQQDFAFDNGPTEVVPRAVPLKEPRTKRRWIWMAGSVAVLALSIVLFFAPTIIRIATNKGELVIEVDDPRVEVLVMPKAAHVVMDKGKTTEREFVLKASDYHVAFFDPSTGAEAVTKEFTIKRGGTVTVRATVREIASAVAKPVVPAKVDLDRALAEWVLKHGGFSYVEVMANDQLTKVRPGELLPSGKLELRLAHLADTADFGTDAMTEFARLKHLEEIEIIRVGPSDSDLGRLLEIPTLTKVTLDFAGVTDKTAEVIAKHPNLRELRLTNNPGLTEFGVRRFATLRELRLLDLKGTAVSLTGAKELAEVLPLCRIERDGGTIEAKVIALDFRETHGATLIGLEEWVKKLPFGYRPMWIAARSGASLPTFDAIALPDLAKRRWRFGHLDDLSDEVRGKREWDAGTKDDYGHMLGAQYRHLGRTGEVRIFADMGDDAWASWYGDPGWMQDKLKEARKDRLPIGSLSVVKTDDGYKFSAQYAGPQGPNWEYKEELSSEDLAKQIGDYRAKGWWPRVLSIYQGQIPIRYVAVFEENAAKESWDVQSELSPTDYEKELVARKEKGIRPRCVSSCELDGNVLYTVVWMGGSASSASPSSHPLAKVGDQPPAKNSIAGDLLAYETFDAPTPGWPPPWPGDGWAKSIVADGVLRTDLPADRNHSAIGHVFGKASAADMAFATRARVNDASLEIKFGFRHGPANDTWYHLNVSPNGSWRLNLMTEDWTAGKPNAKPTILAESTKPDPELSAGKWIAVTGQAAGNNYQLEVNGRGGARGTAAVALASKADQRPFQVGFTAAGKGECWLEVDYAAVWKLPTSKSKEDLPGAADAFPRLAPPNEIIPDSVAPTLEGHTDRIRQIRFMPTGKMAASVAWDGTIRLWNLETGKEEKRFAGDQLMNSLAVSADGNTIAAGGTTHKLYLCDVNTGAKRGINAKHPTAESLLFTPNGDRLLAGMGSGELYLYDCKKTAEITHNKILDKAILGLYLLPGGKQVLCHSAEQAAIVDLEKLTLVRKLDRTPSGICIESMSLFGDGKRVASIHRDGWTRILSLETGEELKKFVAHRDRAVHGTCVFVVPGDKWLVTTGDDKAIRIWDAVTFKKLHEETTPTLATGRAAMSSDGQTLVTGAGWRLTTSTETDGDYKLRVWRLPTPTESKK